MAIPMKNGGMKIAKVLFCVILSGITTGIGAFFGAIVGSISEQIIGICLSFAAGAMLYIVSRGTNSRIQSIISRKNNSNRKYLRISNRHVCYEFITYVFMNVLN